jgi:pimeloyl-ACP methyl ester carboxylesterase
MRVTVNGTDLYVDTDGSHLRVAGDRLVEVPTVVMLHGGPGFDQGYLRPGLAPLAPLADSRATSSRPWRPRTTCASGCRRSRHRRS